MKNNEENDFLPKKIYVRTRKNGDKFELVFSRHRPNYQTMEQFFTVGAYVLQDLYVVGSGFKLSFKPTDEEREESSLLGPKEKKKLTIEEAWNKALRMTKDEDD